jgi:hypothetical protein
MVVLNAKLFCPKLINEIRLQQQQQQQQQARLLAPTVTSAVTCGSQQFFFNSSGNVLTSLPGGQTTATAAPLLLGQMVGSTATSTPILIQVDEPFSFWMYYFTFFLFAVLVCVS